jgi:hypothetical protein
MKAGSDRHIDVGVSEHHFGWEASGMFYAISLDRLEQTYRVVICGET